ncbi:hypothetical protein CC1G_03079 [Coprinopsis cinerea okayama7|uniref:DUF202 domain-containing protein n=1 Tax=Coprinopsis cinerea (strain Okayama-7 / 130 / ATCC MYA-4618 / FGSC 9003) TaxID=240176 RepID=A8PEV0_COPC7|nr:hypothetical protein CC1G_03079 [Coprinopsis cinerea okayama7\|eukprot:XP_001840850.1 hypothetical protein CC1G_03079 [Coprinopsis cinerea okayama7\
MVLKNTASTARDHLASERTYLAYVRTSLGLAVMGVALVQLFVITEITNPSFSQHPPANTLKLQRFSRPLGSLTIAFSFLVLVQGAWRYFKIQFALFDDNFPIARLSVAVQCFIFGAIIITLFGTLLSGN